MQTCIHDVGANGGSCDKQDAVLNRCDPGLAETRKAARGLFETGAFDETG